MKKSALLGGAGMFLAAAGAMLFGLTSTAYAAPLFQSTNSTVKVSGGDVTALNECVQDAQNGVIETQQQACNQISTAGNELDLAGVSVRVYANGFHGALLYSNGHANVKITGGIANAYNSCIQEARNGVIITQQQACAQVATAGNLVTLTGVGITVS